MSGMPVSLCTYSLNKPKWGTDVSLIKNNRPVRLNNLNLYLTEPYAPLDQNNLKGCWNSLCNYHNRLDGCRRVRAYP